MIHIMASYQILNLLALPDGTDVAESRIEDQEWTLALMCMKT